MLKFLAPLILVHALNTISAQDCKIRSQVLVDLSANEVWERISENDELKPEFEYLLDLDLYLITYLSDSLEVQGLLIEPKEDGIYPVVIFNRGGNRTFGALNASTMISYCSKLAQSGYVVIGSNYREKDEFGGAEVNDVLILSETVKAIKKADPTKIGMFGWSRGGMTTYLALKRSDKIRTAIVGNGVSDLFQLLEDRPGLEHTVFEPCIPDYITNKDEALKERSAIFWPEMLNEQSSLLIISGTQDKRAAPEQADELAMKLTELGYDFEHRKFITDHFFTDKKDELNALVIDWFDRRLKNAP